MSRRGGVKEGLVKDQTFATFLGNFPKLKIMNWFSCTIQLISEDMFLSSKQIWRLVIPAEGRSFLSLLTLAEQSKLRSADARSKSEKLFFNAKQYLMT